MSNRPPKPVQYEGIFLTSAEVDAIHARCFPAIRDLWFVLVRTGLRLGEAVVGLALAGLRARRPWLRIPRTCWPVRRSPGGDRV